MVKNKTLSRSILNVALGTVLLLLIPLTAKLFTDEMGWNVADFIFAGTLIFSTGLTYTLITKQSENIMYRSATGLALFSALFLVWSNLAVGIIGSEDNIGNAMYFGVILVLIAASFIANFRPRGMAFALFATAAAQASTIVIALIVGMHHYPGSSVYEIILVNGFFITLFSISGILFLRVPPKADEADTKVED